MSIIAIGRTASGIAIASDTVSYDNDGRVGSVHVSKVSAWPLINLVTGHVGSQNVGQLFNLLLKKLEPTGFDHALSLAEFCFTEAYLEDARMYPVSPGNESRAKVLLAGYSEERKGFEVHRIWTPRANRPAEAFKLHEIEHFFFATGMGMGKPEAQGFSKDLVRKGIEDPNVMLEACIRAVCAGRQGSGLQKEETGEPAGWWQAGGSIECTFLSIGQVQRWVRWHWPEDQPGKPIDPSQGAIGPPEFFPVKQSEEAMS